MVKKRGTELGPNQSFFEPSVNLGPKERDLLVKLYLAGVTVNNGISIQDAVGLQSHAKRYGAIVFKRILRLGAKELVEIRMSGPRGGKRVHFTRKGYGLAKYLAGEGSNES